jgi:small-conductance mechanosensitive channel
MEKEKVPFPFQAARFSFWAPVVSFFLNLTSSGATADSRAVSMVIGLLCMLLVLSGFILAIYALIASGQPRRKGHLAYAIAGLILNGLVIFGWIYVFMAVFRAQQA